MQTARGAALSQPSRRRAVTVLLALGVAVVLADLATKQLTVANLALRENVRLLGGAVYLTHIRNPGAAFGLGGSITWLFPLVAVAVIGWIGWLAWRLRSVLWAVALGLVLGGAAGNLVDRLAREDGKVVDMISLFAPDGSVWPVFNLADMALVVGVVLAVWLELTGRHRDGTRAPGRRSGAPGRPEAVAGAEPGAEQ